jgi:hypothetical protein
MADDPKKQEGGAESLLALAQDEDGDSTNAPAEAAGDDPFGDLFAEEEVTDERLAAFADLELLTMVEVAAEVEAVLEELRIRQGG